MNEMTKGVLSKIRPHAEMSWIFRERVMLDLLLWADITNFLNWPLIQGTMAIDDPPDEVLIYLQSLPDWDIWKEAMMETPIGHPNPHKIFKESSGNLIFQAYRLAVFISETGCNLKDLDLIVEFGGGYGSSCRLAYRLGFDGEYVMQDLLAFLVLQEYYLRASKVYPPANIKFEQNIYKFIDTIGNNHHRKSFFIASFSLSEASFTARDDIFEVVLKGIDYISIWYQRQWNELDNGKYFHKLEMKYNDYIWKHKEYHPELYYLLGKRK